MSTSRDRGVQPLDQILNTLNLKHEDLVQCSSEQLTHKMVKRGREGRLLTRHIQEKICKALNACQSKKLYRVRDIFNY